MGKIEWQGGDWFGGGRGGWGGVRLIEHGDGGTFDIDGNEDFWGEFGGEDDFFEIKIKEKRTVESEGEEEGEDHPFEHGIGTRDIRGEEDISSHNLR